MLRSVPLLSKRSRTGPRRSSAAIALIRKADAARDRRAYRHAASLYEQALALNPDDAPIHVQCGHMLKEAGEFAKAEEHYKRAQVLIPNDADLALQIGHLYKVAGQLRLAEDSYARALQLMPDWQEAIGELAALHSYGFSGRNAAPEAHPAGSLGQPRGAGNTDFDRHAAEFGLLASLEGLAPELAPSHPRDLTRHHQESIVVQRFGRNERTRWGMRNTLRGVEAVRGHCVSKVPIVEVQLLIDGLIIHRETAVQGVQIKDEREHTRLRKYNFNIWFDFTAFERGRFDIELRMVDARKETRSHHEFVVIAEPLSPEQYPTSDGIVAVAAGDPRPVDVQVNAQPSMIRPAQRSVFLQPPRNILVLRLDQLGDMVASVPALRRLRQIFPDARLTGLIAPANAGLAASLKLFDEILLADFPDDPLERRRVMPLAQQHELRRMLAPYRFDLAIDMSESDVSRPLLLLSGAPFVYGFKHGNFTWLSAGFEGFARDFANEREVAPHTAKMMGLIEWLGTISKRHSEIVPRTDLSRSLLSKYGIAENEKFVVFHTGARLVFSRWPYYDQLSLMVLKQTGLKVVMLTDDPKMRERLPAGLSRSDRFQLLDQRLDFDEFDALLSFCAVFVGNDSGPKHLAALRGANVVSIHCARNNWNEWGQESKGYIVSRRVPCAGCGIHHEPEDCGRGFPCVVNISAQEIFGAIAEFL